MGYVIQCVTMNLHNVTVLRSGHAFLRSAMVDWVGRHGARESNVFDGIEISRNVSESWASLVRQKV